MFSQSRRSSRRTCRSWRRLEFCARVARDGVGASAQLRRRCGHSATLNDRSRGPRWRYNRTPQGCTKLTPQWCLPPRANVRETPSNSPVAGCDDRSSPRRFPVSRVSPPCSPFAMRWPSGPTMLAAPTPPPRCSPASVRRWPARDNPAGVDGARMVLSSSPGATPRTSGRRFRGLPTLQTTGAVDHNF